MERRLLLALVLTALVLIVTPLLFPPPPQSARQQARASGDTTASKTALTPAPLQTVDTLPAASVPSDTAPTGVQPSTTRADTVVVETPGVRYALSTLGAVPVGAEMKQFRALAPGEEGRVQVARDGEPLLFYRVVIGADTIDLTRVAFSVSGDPGLAARGSVPLVFRAPVPGGEAVISYTFVPDSHVVRVRGEISAPRAGPLIVYMPNGIRSSEADSLDDQRHLAYVFKPVNDDARSAPFSKLEGRERIEPGPFVWVGSKTKYFLVALLTEEGQEPFGTARFRAPPKTGKMVTRADAEVVKPLSREGRFAFEMYVGPQEWQRLRAMGRDLDNANPYGGFLQGFVQPFATIVMRMLLWMHDTLKLSYGWVLVIFGIVVRLILWPLNQGAMRTSIRMQRLQPELTEIQKRHRQQPEKAHAEMMRVYKEHNLSPFSMFSGCLPMLLPMPVLFALFFVFQNTIEFRGVSFLWLPDISLKDPYYIIPVLMGLSMYLLSWIGMRGVPPSPQTRMMAYFFPGFMTFLFLNFPSGLNLYYAVQNIAALPQQWLIARERAKAGPPPKPARP